MDSAIEAARRVKHIFDESSALKTRCASVLPNLIADAARKLIVALRAGNKILTCGNGGSAADAQHFSSELLNRFEREREGLPAVALTTDTSTLTSIANDFDFSQIFARQIHALGRQGDVLLAFSTSGRSPNIVAALQAAQARGMGAVLLTGRDGGPAASKLQATDLELRVPAESTARIQEIHLTIIHCLCDLIDREYLGEHQ